MRRPYAWESTLIVSVFLLLLLGLNLVVGVLRLTLDLLILSPILIFGELLFLGLTVAWVAARRLPWQETFYLSQTSWVMIGLSILVALTWWPVATGLGTLMEQLFSLIGPPPELPPPQNGFDALGYFVAIVILAPLCEEPIFRGFIMRGWLRHGFLAGVVASGMLFGLQHAQLTGAVPLSLVGVVLGVVVFRAGSLWPAVVIHSVYNGLSVPFLLSPDSMPDISDATFIIAGAMAIPVAVCALWLFHRLAPPFQPPEREPFTPGQRLGTIIAWLTVVGMVMTMALLEVFVRLYPDMAGV